DWRRPIIEVTFLKPTVAVVYEDRGRDVAAHGGQDDVEIAVGVDVGDVDIQGRLIRRELKLLRSATRELDLEVVLRSSVLSTDTTGDRDVRLAIRVEIRKCLRETERCGCGAEVNRR